MRQAKKEITDKAAIVSLLGDCHVGRLGTNGLDGYPMVKPLNFVYADGRIYIHSAREGEKINDIRRDNRVCFEADLPIALVKAAENPCGAEYLYRSVILKGRAFIVEDEEERIHGLKLLMDKYQPEGGFGPFLEEKLKLTAVIRIDVEEITGKEDLGKDHIKEAAVKALENKGVLPTVFSRR